jgi:uncharacterized protein YfaT (DUF1175 family)
LIKKLKHNKKSVTYSASLKNGVGKGEVFNENQTKNKSDNFFNRVASDKDKDKPYKWADQDCMEEKKFICEMPEICFRQYCTN